MGLGHLIAADEYAADFAFLIADRFVDEVDKLNLVAAPQAQLHGRE